MKKINLIKMINAFTKIILLLSAYLPLTWIIVIKYYPIFNYYGLIIAFLYSIIIFIILKKFLKSTTSLQPKKYDEIKIRESKNSTTMGFLVTYMFSFLPSTSDLYSNLALILQFTLIGYLYLTTEMMAINPLLQLFFKYNVYIAEYNQKKIFVLTKEKYLSRIYSINLILLDNEIYIEQRGK